MDFEVALRTLVDGEVRFVIVDRDTVLAGLNFTLTTDLGDLDVLGEITGIGGFEAVNSRSIDLELFGFRCRCLDLDGLIDAKRAAGRPKDLQTLAELEAIRDERGPE